MRALVLSGGGSKGQYHVGAVQALVCELRKAYDVYCGVSVGALVAAHLAQFPEREARQGADALAHLFSSIHTEDIYRHWFLVRELASLWKPAVFDASPLRKLISTHLDVDRVRASGKKLRIGATNLSNGSYHIFTEETPMLREAVYASAAYPVAFSPSHFNGSWWVDGGVRSVTPLESAFRLGATEIDVVMAFPPKSTRVFDPKPETIDVALRSVELMSDQIVEDDVKKATLYNRLLEAGVDCGTKEAAKLTIIRPSEPLDVNALHFDPADARRLQHRGFRDALEAATKPL